MLLDIVDDKVYDVYSSVAGGTGQRGANAQPMIPSDI